MAECAVAEAGFPRITIVSYGGPRGLPLLTESSLFPFGIALAQDGGSSAREDSIVVYTSAARRSAGKRHRDHSDIDRDCMIVVDTTSQAAILAQAQYEPAAPLCCHGERGRR
jgi:hypothetical protein